jgi:membrane fusion protein
VASIVTTAPRAGAADAASGDASVAGADAVARPPAGADLHAHLYAPTRKAGFVRTGQTVWLRLDAYPYQKYGMARGVVAHVSDAPLAPQDLPSGQGGPLQAAAQSGEPLLRITVHLAKQHVLADGRRWPLRPSTTLEADVLQERRAVWEWLFEPLLAARERSKVLSSHPSRDEQGG